MSDKSRRPLPAHRDLRAWDVRSADGRLVTDVVGLGLVLGMSPSAAAAWVRAQEGQRAMPDELIVEANAFE
ncbi:hypothetical protein [Rhodococcus pyridinivorans]|uniref:hypothetical protein n=1 Tax=Rhodococcus pyridinivorans TaxID=103816 RepID=UPI000A9984BA|nr:hypothetical protein [Rhodococcus pyridinivorans]